MAIVKFSSMGFGNYETDVVVAAITQTSTSNGKPMLKVSICDGEESITALIFDSTKKDLNDAGIEDGCTAVINLEVTDYKGSKSYKITNINPVKLPEDELKQLIELPPIDP